ncbi:MAG: hypothetical protein ACT443_06420 [Gemmatimonadota bacterium]
MRTPGVFVDDAPGARAKAVLRALLAFVVFPNLLFHFLGLFLFTNRALVNLDYIALGAAWLWLPVWLRVAGFGVLVILDAITSTAAMYNIHIFAGAIAVMDAPIGLQITVALGLAIAIAIAAGIGFFALKFLSDRRRRFLVLAAMLVSGVSLFATASSSTRRFIYDLRDRIRSAAPGAYPVAAASDSLRDDVDHGELRGENVLLVLVESLGALRDSTLRSFVWQPLASPAIRARYDTRGGVVDFRGGTTSGELRELCGIFADYITLPAAALPRCLPRRLAARGYTTFAVHGYTPAYYDRAQWYPLLFDSIYFDDALARTTPGRRCGTQFRGICDRAAILAIERMLRDGERRFVYWLTLDAHTPIDLPRMDEFRAAWQSSGIGELDVCRKAPGICLQGLFWRDLMERLAALATDPALPPLRILIVGDHAPAFVRRDRGEEFVYGNVPFLELITRTPKRTSGIR